MGTCWINAASAFFTLLHKYKEAKNNGHCFTIQDIINGFKTDKADTLSPLEEEIISYSTINFFPDTKSFKEKKLNEDDLIVKSDFLKQFIEQFMVNKERFEMASKRLELAKLNSMMTDWERQDQLVLVC